VPEFATAKAALIVKKESSRDVPSFESLPDLETYRTLSTPIKEGGNCHFKPSVAAVKTSPVLPLEPVESYRELES